MFIHEIFKNADPKSLAMTGESNVTYGQLEKAVENYRNTLYAMGIRRGDTVGLYTANRAEFVYVYMAVVSLGAIIVPVNNSLVGREVDFILRDAESKLLISDMPLTVSMPFIDIHDLDYRASTENAPKAPAFPADLTEDDVCALIYTSGTTGSPKGAMITHKNQVRNVEQYTAVVRFKPEDKVLCVLPMFHCYGLTTVVLGGLLPPFHHRHPPLQKPNGNHQYDHEILRHHRDYGAAALQPACPPRRTEQHENGAHLCFRRCIPSPACGTIFL